VKRFDTRTYSISDFIEWDARKLLDFSPDFQRRSVWSDKAKSYLVDTVVRELPMPKLIISQTFSVSKQVRIVVDGQQRIRTLLDYYKGNFSIKRMHNVELGGKTFSSLTEDLQQTFLRYELGVDVMFDATYEELIEIFSRINTYTVKLNAQELRNAKYLGYFKQAAFSVGKRYATFFVENKILRTGEISRMAEAELASNLLIVCLSGIESNKSIDVYYKKFEDNEGELQHAINLLDKVMSTIGEIYPDQEMAETIWCGEPLFYSLFAAIRNAYRPLSVAQGADSIAQFSLLNTGRLRVLLDSLSADFVAADNEQFDAARNPLIRFIDVSRRRTADVGSRIERTRFICNYLSESLKQ
jgi:hypothetical protein